LFQRRVDPRVTAGTLLAVAVAAIMTTLPRGGLLAHTVADDALYYLAIAKRAGDAHWPTFDGVHTTTGFHPLWLFVLVPLAKTFSFAWTFLRVAIAVSSALMIAASLSFGRLFGRAWGTNAGVVATVLLVASPGTSRLGWMTMEAPLALLLLAFFLLEMFRRPARATYLGTLTGLVILARLDMAIVVAVAMCWMVLVKRRIRLRSAIVAALIASAVVAPYVAWNVALTGHATTISSATKAYVAGDAAARRHGGRLNMRFVGDVIAELGRAGGDIARLSPASMLAGPVGLAGGDHPNAVDPGRHRGAILLLAATALLLGWAFARGCERRFGVLSSESSDLRLDPLIILAIASAGHATIACVFLTGQSGPWYWGLEVVTLAAAASYASARWQVARRVASLACGATIVSMAMLAAGLLASRGAGRFNQRASFASVMLEAGKALDARRAPGEIVGSCNAGTLGFFEPGVVNLDGLVNDWSLLEARRRGDMRGYLARENVRWVVDCVPATAMARYARQLGLDPGEIESKVEISGPGCVGFVWHLANPAPIASRP
jgi:hypothetical protein